MLHSNDTGRKRRTVRSRTDARRVRPSSSDREDDRSGGAPDGGGKRDQGRFDCPVCEFASDEYDDVYVHLMTSHRKSTVSAALLRRE
jgi:hypothetical protein